MTIRQRPELSPLPPQPPGGGQPQPGQPARIPPQQPPSQQRPLQPPPIARPPQQQPQPGAPTPRPPAAPKPDDGDVPIEGGAPARGAAAPVPGGLNPKIHSFGGGYGAGRHEDKWKRSPNATGTGATHVRSFHCKLAEDSLTYLDQQINEWLDAHPQYEVKFVTVTVGEWTGKTKEQNLIMHVWV